MEKLAEALGVSRQTVVNLLKKKGCPGKTEQGYDVQAWKVWDDMQLIRMNRIPRHGTQQRGESGPNSEGQTPVDLRTRTMPQLRAEEAALKIEERRLKVGRLNGELIPRETVEMVLGKFVSELRTRLVGIKGQAPRLAMMSDVVEVERLLERELTSAMDGVSRLPYKPANFSDN